MLHNLDTIAAIATPPGEGGIAIIRVCGPRCFEIADAVFRCPGRKPSARDGGTFVFGHIVFDKETIDAALCLIMRAPRSFTGEDTIEFHGHGGPVLARRILRAVLAAGAQMAEPGEFSRRAFLNGKLDLLQAEAILDAIRSKSDRAATAAIEQLEGCLSKQFTSIYDGLMSVASDLAATLDFPEDELPEHVLDEINIQLEKSLLDIDSLLSSWGEGHLLREGATVVIAGRPNAGKSTLMNALLGKDRAIVSHIPGTTRDVIEEGLVLNGIPIRLVDTAGLRDADCEIEREGIRRSKTQLERADLFLYVIDSSLPVHADDQHWLAKLDSNRLIIVMNKTDLRREIDKNFTTVATIIETCLSDQRGLDELRLAISTKLEGSLPTGGHHASISERHRVLLSAAKAAVAASISLIKSGQDGAAALASDELRAALEAIGRATGRVYEDELLDNIFSRFCIGK